MHRKIRKEYQIRFLLELRKCNASSSPSNSSMLIVVPCTGTMSDDAKPYFFTCRGLAQKLVGTGPYSGMDDFRTKPTVTSTGSISIYPNGTVFYVVFYMLTVAVFETFHPSSLELIPYPFNISLRYMNHYG